MGKTRVILVSNMSKIWVKHGLYLGQTWVNMGKTRIILGSNMGKTASLLCPNLGIYSLNDG